MGIFCTRGTRRGCLRTRGLGSKGQGWPSVVVSILWANYPDGLYVYSLSFAFHSLMCLYRMGE